MKEKMDEFDWINTHKVNIRDLKIGDVVFIKCSRHKLTDVDEELTVSEIYDSYRKGEICVALKNMGNMKYPFGDDKEGVTNGIHLCEHINCDIYLNI